MRAASLACLACLVSLTPGLALPQTPPGRITFENATGHRILRLYEECYAVSDCDWDDILGDRVLDPGETTWIPVTEQDSSSGCVRDYRAELPDDQRVRVENINSCEAAVIRFGPPKSD